VNLLTLFYLLFGVQGGAEGPMRGLLLTAWSGVQLTWGTKGDGAGQVIAYVHLQIAANGQPGAFIDSF
jgi:hypothetical protein